MPRGRQTAQKASTLAFAEVLARGRIPRICFLDLQLQGRPRLDDLSRQLRGKIRARGGVSQKPRAPEQPRVTTIDCLQLVLRDSLRILGDYLIRRPAICRHPRSEEHTSELQSRLHLVCRLLLEKKKNKYYISMNTHRAQPNL